MDYALGRHQDDPGSRPELVLRISQSLKPLPCFVARYVKP